MRYTITIHTDGAAFHTDDGRPDAGPEVARILRDLADKVEPCRNLPARTGLRDTNGITVGNARVFCPICNKAVEDHYPEEAEACSDALHDRARAD